MKKMTVVLFSFTLMFALAACACKTTNGTEDTTNKGPIDKPTSTENGIADTNNDIVNQSDFDVITVVDNEECLIRIDGIEADGKWGYTLNTYLENRSSDKTYMYSLDSITVNGVHSDTFFAVEVAPEKKANKDISISDEVLEENGITEFTDIELTFRVYDSNDWTSEDVALVTTNVYPKGEEHAQDFKREPDDEDVVLVDNENVSVIVTDQEMDDVWGYGVELYLINKTEKEALFTVNDASVNGYMADPFFAKEVGAGKSAFAEMTWSKEQLEENGITEVEEIIMWMRAYDSENMLEEDFVNEEVIIQP